MAAENNTAKRKSPWEKGPQEVVSKRPRAESWRLDSGSVFARIVADSSGQKIAGFDLDSTLVNTKTGGRFATTAQDWCWFNPAVPDKLKELIADGFKIVIFTNQGGIKSAVNGVQATKVKARIDNVLGALEGCDNIRAFAACQKDQFRKPCTGMWELMERSSGVTANKEISFYCGDAAGRPGDHSADDKQFAAAVGLEFRLPEDIFGPSAKANAAAAELTGPNSTLAGAFRELGQLEAKNLDKPRASLYRSAARTLGRHPQKITSGKQAQKLAGIGKAVGEKVDEWLATTSISKLDELRRKFQ